MSTEVTEAKQSSNQQSNPTQNGKGPLLVLVKKTSKKDKVYYTVLHDGQEITIGGKKLVAFQSRSNENNICIFAFEDKVKQAVFSSMKELIG